MLFVTRFGALDIGLLNAAICFGPVPMLSLNEPLPFETVEGGSKEYVRKMAEEIPDVRLSCPVEGISRHARGVNIRVDGNVESFDHVVMATDAHTALHLLDEATPAERLLLGDVYYEPCRMVVHTDPAVMPADDDEWAAYSYRAAGCHPMAVGSYSNYYLRRVQSWIKNDIFATTNPPEGLIDPKKVIHVQDGWKHIRGDSLQYLRAAEMYRIQGTKRTWHCGSHVADSAWHEGSLRTGLAVAAALGADYPFEDDPAARQSFYDMATDLMRVLPRRAGSPASESIWPQSVLRSARRLIQDSVRSQIREKLRLGLPQTLFHPASPLAWIREAATRCIEPTVSPYQETKKTFRPCEIDGGITPQPFKPHRAPSGSPVSSR
jgi:hypothetical protein